MAKSDPTRVQLQPRTGQPDPKLTPAEFDARFRLRFRDPAFAPLETEIARLPAVAWDAYHEGRKSQHTHPAGTGFADPDFDLSDEWRATHDALEQCERRQRDPATPSRILQVCASPRSEHTCPGEMSKSYGLVETVRAEVTGSGVDCDVLELNRLTSEYGRTIHPCKGCV